MSFKWNIRISIEVNASCSSGNICQVHATAVVKYCLCNTEVPQAMLPCRICYHDSGCLTTIDRAVVPPIAVDAVENVTVNSHQLHIELGGTVAGLFTIQIFISLGRGGMNEMQF